LNGWKIKRRRPSMKKKILKELKGKTIVSVKGKIYDNEMIFVTDTGESYRFYHKQDCCEMVSIEDIIGDMNDLIGSPIAMAEEITSNKNPKDIKKEYQESFTWTFYKFATIKGYVTIRWYGESNGCYSESVNFEKIKENI
jgi:hypothetical protein